MAENKTILEEVKEYLGIQSEIDPESTQVVTDDSFDATITNHISGALDILSQNGVGDYVVFDKDTTYDDYLKNQEKNTVGLVKNYVNLYVQSVFDPPAPSTLNVIKERLPELLWRINVYYNTEVKKDGL